MIAVYSENDVGGLIEYSIEVTQNSMILKDNQNIENHLYEGSIAHYEYEVSKDESNVIVEVSDCNKNCAQIYFSDKEYASSNNYLVK